MSEDELDAIRNRKLAELQQDAAREQIAEQQAAFEAELARLKERDE